MQFIVSCQPLSASPPSRKPSPQSFTNPVANPNSTFIPDGMHGRLALHHQHGACKLNIKLPSLPLPPLVSVPCCLHYRPPCLLQHWLHPLALHATLLCRLQPRPFLVNGGTVQQRMEPPILESYGWVVVAAGWFTRCWHERFTVQCFQSWCLQMVVDVHVPLLWVGPWL